MKIRTNATALAGAAGLCAVGLAAAAALGGSNEATAKENGLQRAQTNGVGAARAWVDRMPPGPARLHVQIDAVGVPTPCHGVTARHIGDQRSNPPGMMLQIEFTEPEPGQMCVQQVTQVAFSYTMANYTGTHNRVVISHPWGGGVTVPIETAY